MVCNCTYPVLNPTTPKLHITCYSNWEACITNIQQWMPLNGLKLNDNKTESFTLRSCHQPIPPDTPIEFGSNLIEPSPTTKNLCVMIDETLTLKPHISNLSKAAYFQLRRISHIRCFLTMEATKTLVHSLIYQLHTVQNHW